MSLLSQLFAKGEQRTVLDTPLEAVNYASGLASNQQAIDVILDQVRAVTSELQPGQNPSADQETKLLQVYLSLETYLATKEPLRTFPREELRKRLAPKLLGRLQAYEAAGRPTSKTQTK